MNLGSLKRPKWQLLFLCSFLTASAFALLESDNNASYLKKDESQLWSAKSLIIGESEQSLQQKRELIRALQSLRMHNVTRNQRAVHREYPANAPQASYELTNIPEINEHKSKEENTDKQRGKKKIKFGW